jgi:hypothetical protein
MHWPLPTAFASATSRPVVSIILMCASLGSNPREGAASDLGLLQWLIFLKK